MPASEQSFGSKLKETTAAVRFSHAKFGARRALKRSERDRAAETFHADGSSLSASKRIIDTRDPAYKAVTGVISRAKRYWRDMTVPYPERGIRLIRRDRIAEFNGKLREFKTELREAADALHAAYDALCQSAQTSLGELFSVGDYPSIIGDEFSIEWDFPTIEAPEYLKTLNPALYEAEQAKVDARFNDAVMLAEQAFTAELHGLVSNLLERLKPDATGEQKVFRDKSVTNLKEFFDRFKEMSTGSNPALVQLVNQAQAALRGEGDQLINPTDLRNSADLQTQIANSLGSVAEVLDTLLVAKPTRSIVLEDEPASTEPASTEPTSSDEQADESQADQSHDSEEETESESA